MKERVVAISLVASLAVLSIAGDGPKIEFEKTSQEFGRVSTQSVTGSFRFTNKGDAILKLEQPITSCGCTVAGLKPDQLQPGETGEIAFTVEMPSVPKAMKETISITSNDPKNPKIDLTIKADYVPLFESRPRVVRMEVRSGSEFTAILEVKRTDNKKLNITRIETSKPWLTAKLVRIDRSNDQKAGVSLTAKPDGSPRPITEYLRVFVDNSEQSALTIFINGRILGDIAVTPETVFWNIVDRGPSKSTDPNTLAVQRLIATSTVPEQTFELSNPACSIQELNLELVQVEKGKRYEIIARLTKIPTETVHGTISVDSNLSSQRKIWLPVTIAVVKGDQTE